MPKKPIMHINQDNTISPDSSSLKSSSVSRIRQYPEPTQNFRREVHAPHRKSMYSFFSSFFGPPRGNPKPPNENILNAQYEQRKVSAIGTIRYYGKDNEVTDAAVKKCVRSKDVSSLNSRYEQSKGLAFGTLQHSGNDGDVVIDLETKKCSKDVISDDSSVEELEVVEIPDMKTQRSPVASGGVIMIDRLSERTDNDRPTTSMSVSDLNDHEVMVDDVGKMMESMSVNPGLDIHPHRTLYDSAEKRNSQLNFLPIKFGSINFQDVYREPFVPLTNDEDAQVSFAFSSSNRRKILVTHQNSNIDITGQILQCLKPGSWLNDEVINLYLELLKEREQREPKKFLKCHFFNTFFYKKLIGGKNGYDFQSVRRWTTQRKIGYTLLECDKIFVPIHKEIHWCLAVINIRDKKFQYLDSLRGVDKQVLNVLAKYFVDEVNDKSAEAINLDSWKVEYVHDLPLQKNGSDCGMFMIKYTDFYSRGLALYFEQEHIPYFRRRTAKEILKLKAE